MNKITAAPINTREPKANFPHAEKKSGRGGFRTGFQAFRQRFLPATSKLHTAVALRSRGLVGGVVSLVAAGCVASDSIVSLPGSDFSVASSTLCQLGCWDVDSFPDSVGVFLNYSSLPELCFDAYEQDDLDYDGISEFCEVRLAEAFAPRMIYTENDDISGEPRYAVRKGDTGDEVVIMYMPSMYYDTGWSRWLCGTLPLPSAWCGPHFGDSETAVIIVDYNPSTYHWFLKSALFSQHDSYVFYDALDLDYAFESLGRPDIWVSYSKHALYNSFAECQSGGTFGSDSCYTPTANFILRAYPVDNVGSSSNNFIDCTYSYNPVFNPGGDQECYWTYTGPTGTFGGWQGGATPQAPESYGHRLLSFGF